MGFKILIIIEGWLRVESVMIRQNIRDLVKFFFLILPLSGILAGSAGRLEVSVENFPVDR